ncbi:hypothetical protein VPH35_117168 [Triticum aestivum]
MVAVGTERGRKAVGSPPAGGSSIGADEATDVIHRLPRCSSASAREEAAGGGMSSTGRIRERGKERIPARRLLGSVQPWSWRCGFPASLLHLHVDLGGTLDVAPPMAVARFGVRGAITSLALNGDVDLLLTDMPLFRAAS